MRPRSEPASPGTGAGRRTGGTKKGGTRGDSPARCAGVFSEFATDGIGLRAVRDPYHFRDIHTTILHQLGLDQEQLTYLHLGRKERLTSILGKVIRQIV